MLSAAPPAQGASDSDVPTPSAITRHRAGTVSAGPAGLPRRSDPMVEPVLFQSAGVEKPIEKPTGPRPMTPPQEEPAAAEHPGAKPLALDATPTAAPVPQTQATPLPTAPTPGKAAPAGRALGDRRPTTKRQSSGSQAESPLTTLLEWRPSSRTLTATGGGLAIAVGLVLSFTWLLRSLMPKSARPLPRDVVEVLGRAPLGGKQTTQLVRVGSKLVLVAITPDGAETLTEITDPDEVARLVAACDAKRGAGSTAEFDQLLQQMSDERSTPGFLDRAANDEVEAAFDPRSLAAAYANTPGGRGDG